ncbi:hypothetical protein IV203_018777 [Nitzschia inconspicua]|uniref:Uncharacterized protein n=1 Tax=Nitzschia inconspicua TaxID=303405 RepID=A0A9K3M205_9STRA|nr:hypothetical protein IV203_018777 [Nitzschia inconspicua]
MKFTVATAAILAQTTVTDAASSSIATGSSQTQDLTSSFHGGRELTVNNVPNRHLLEDLSGLLSSTNKEDHHAMVIAKTLLKNKKQKAVDTFLSSTSRGQKLKGWISEGRKQQLIGMVQREEIIQECDPYQSSSYDDAVVDVGILSCGKGRYCLESSFVSSAEYPVESSLGGVCVDMPAESTIDLLDSIMITTQKDQLGSRNLQGNYSTIIEDMNTICYGNLTGPNVACECEGVDVAAYTGSLSCSYQEICGDLENLCEDTVTFCYAITYSLSVTAPYIGGLQIQYDFSSPFVLQYQYGITYNGSPSPETCTITFDGNQCSSCEFQEASECFTFDCSNTDNGLTGTVCGNATVVEEVLADYLVFANLPCPGGCNICGGGYMTLRDNNITLPTGQTYICELVEIAALAGYFTGSREEMCTMLPPLVEETCGCEGGTIDGTAAPSPADVDVDAPSDTPAAAPVDVAPTPAEQPTQVSSAVKSSIGLAAATTAAAMGWVLQQVMSA